MKLFVRIIHLLFLKIQNAKKIYYKYLFNSAGKNISIWGNINLKNPQNIKIGNNVSFNDGCYVNGYGGIEIGDNVAISANAIIVSTSLDINMLREKKHINKSIKIGDNVQIGAGAIILPGVKIGNNVMVGAGTVVTKEFGDNVVIAGNPGKILKQIK